MTPGAVAPWEPLGAERGLGWVLFSCERQGSCETCWGQSQIQNKGFRLCVRGMVCKMVMEPTVIFFPVGLRPWFSLDLGKGLGCHTRVHV